MNGLAVGCRGEECDVIYVISYCSCMPKMLLSFAVLLSLIWFPFLSPCSCSFSSVFRCWLRHRPRRIYNGNTAHTRHFHIHLNVTTVLPPAEQEAGWSLESIWTNKKRELYLYLAGSLVTIVHSPACSAVMMLTTILRLLTSIDSLNLLYKQCDVIYKEP